MGTLLKPTRSELMQLDDIARNLGIGKQWSGSKMVADAVDASLRRADPLLKEVAPRGELVAEKLASHYHVRFEEVRTEKDIDILEDRYLRCKKEIGFAQLREELRNPKIDALLFRRLHAKEDDSDRWVAILNLLVTQDRAYWSRFHELSHRIAEPQQRLLPFKRERVDDKNAVEALIDTIAGALGFHKRLFGPLVSAVHGCPLTFEKIRGMRDAYAPTASLLAVTNAVVAMWPRPALAFVACVRGRVSDDRQDRALRVAPQGRNDIARQEALYVIPNMRVPQASVVYDVFHSGNDQTDFERCGIWETSDGTRLPDHKVLISATRIGEQVYCVMSA